MKKYQDAMIADICRLVEIPSVYEESDAYPFGAAVNRCLDAAMEMMQQMGFRTVKAPDGKYAYAEIGEGELFGVLGHMDVVPARKEDGWEHDPFRPFVKDGWLCGRGTQDDKSPMVAAIYGLKSLLDEGAQLNRRVRFIFGADEENLWRCMAAYSAREEHPASGFTPDSTFPLTYAEKGLLQVKIHSDEPAAFPCRGGDSFNAVSGHANCPRNAKIEAALDDHGFGWHEEDDELVVEGITAHAKNPWKGVNANLRLLRVLSDLGITDNAIRFACDTLDEKFRFEGFSDRDYSDFSGPATINLGKMDCTEQGTVFSADLRLPATMEKETALALLRKRAVEYHMTVEEFDWLRPIHVPLESQLVQDLLSAYREVTGDTETAPYISAGATYARAFDNCVAFGANLPTEPTSEHQPNERVRVDALVQAAEVYRRAFQKCVVET